MLWIAERIWLVYQVLVRGDYYEDKENNTIAIKSWRPGEVLEFGRGGSDA